MAFLSSLFTMHRISKAVVIYGYHNPGCLLPRTMKQYLVYRMGHGLDGWTTSPSAVTQPARRGKRPSGVVLQGTKRSGSAR